HGRYGEFISCSGYPDCKYIKQNFIGVKCPQCEDGELVEKKARRRGNTFYGCFHYSKVDFTSPFKPGAEAWPQCGRPFFVEKAFKFGFNAGWPKQQKEVGREKRAAQAEGKSQEARQKGRG